MVNIAEDKYWKAFEKLPPALKDAFLAEETAEAVYNICKLCQIEDIKTVSDYVGEVLLGFMTPDEFFNKIKELFSLDLSIFQKFKMYINHYVFDPVRDELEKIYSNFSSSSPQNNKAHLEG